jgi:hypothetical protein
LNPDQGEPEIAVDPTRPGTIVVSISARGVATSHDNGRTWTFTSLPNQGDSVLTVDVAGHFYYSSLSGDVQESVDHGDHWTSVGNWVGALAAQAEKVLPDELKGPSSFRFVGCNAPSPFGPVSPGDGPSLHVIACDRPWLSGDSAVPGLLRVSFTDHTNGSGGDPVANASCPGGNTVLRYAACGREFVSTSHDGGRSWGPFRPTDSADAPAALTNGFAGPVLSSRGRLAAAYVAGRFPGSSCYPCFVLALSVEEGRTWVRRRIPAVVHGGDLMPDTPVRVGPGTSIGFEPYLAADPSTPGRFAVGIFDDAQKLRVYVTSNDGRTWTTPTRLAGPAGTIGHVPWLAYGPSGALGVMWKSASPDATTFDTWAAVAPRGDNRFLPPVRLSRVTSHGPAEKPAYDDASGVTMSKTALHATWGDWRNPDAIGVYYGSYRFAGARP